MLGLFENPGITRRIVKTLTNAQVVTMFSAPTLIIPAPPAGSLIRVVAWTIENINGGTAYTGGGAIGLFYGNASPPTVPVTTIAATFLTSPTVTTIQAVAGNVSATPSVNMVGVGIYLANQTANFAQVGGAGTLRVEVQYTISGGW